MVGDDIFRAHAASPWFLEDHTRTDDPGAIVEQVGRWPIGPGGLRLADQESIEISGRLSPVVEATRGNLKLRLDTRHEAGNLE
jgi:hypothetical protein